jgi:chromosome segregation ATPase
MIFRLLTVAVLLMHAPVPAFAADADDMNAEVDELNADSDAAAADTAEVKARMAKDKARADRALRAAKQQNQAAAAKRQASADQIKQNDQEVANLTAEQTRLKNEVDRLERETALSDQQAKESGAQIEKLKGEIEALKALRNEKAQNFIMLSTQHDKITEEMKKMELEKSQLEIDLAKSKEQEKAANDNLLKVKAEEAAKKVKLDAYIAGLRERYHQAQERIAAMEAEGTSAKTATQKLEATAKVAENEVIAAEGVITRGPSSAPPAAEAKDESYVFKRSCKVIEQPARGAKVLTVQKTGTEVAKTAEGKTWIGFSLEDGRKAYAAKSCF